MLPAPPLRRRVRSAHDRVPHRRAADDGAADEPARAAEERYAIEAVRSSVLGALLLAGQLAGIGIDDIGWPIWVIGVGVVIFVIGLLVAKEQGMVIGGTIVTTVGLVLLYQDQTDRWESWAYAWALVGPAASGLGLALWGLRSGAAATSQRDVGAARRARDLRRRLPVLRGCYRHRRRSVRVPRVAAAGGSHRDRGGRAGRGCWKCQQR